MWRTREREVVGAAPDHRLDQLAVLFLTL